MHASCVRSKNEFNTRDSLARHAVLDARVTRGIHHMLREACTASGLTVSSPVHESKCSKNHDTYKIPHKLVKPFK